MHYGSSVLQIFHGLQLDLKKLQADFVLSAVKTSA